MNADDWDVEKKYHSLLILGGSGFIGSHLAAALSPHGYRILVPTRRLPRADHLLVLPTVRTVEADIHDETELVRLLDGVDAVINLVGILHGAPKPGSPYGDAFARAHVELPRKIVAACAAQGVHRYLHMSALGADRNGPSMYQRSKADGELAARSNPAVGTTIFRPAVVFGEGDRFLSLFAQLQKYFPFMALACAHAKFQPVYVGDVVRAFVHALEHDHTIGKTYELAGPKVYTLRQLVELAGQYAGHPRPVLALPPALAHMQAWLLEHAPGGPLLSRDNLDSMKADNVATHPIDPELDITPALLEAVAPAYLGPRYGTRLDAVRGKH